MNIFGTIAYCVLRIAYCVLRIAYCVLRFEKREKGKGKRENDKCLKHFFRGN